MIESSRVGVLLDLAVPLIHVELGEPGAELPQLIWGKNRDSFFKIE